MVKPKRQAGRPPSDRQASLTEARTRESLARAEKIEVLNRRLKAELLPAEEVRHLWLEMVAHLRARVLQLPTKLLPLLQAAANRAEAKDILDRCVHECLIELSELDAGRIKNVAQAEFDEEKDDPQGI